MIVTLTANPALDRTIVLDAPLRPGEVQGAASAREDAGGKGINVSRGVAAAGEATLAVLPLAADDPLRAALTSGAVPIRAVEVHGHARANIAITDPAGETTKLNLPGPVLTASELEDLIAAAVEAAEDAAWLVLAGSLPPGAADDFYVSVTNAVRARWGAAAPRIAVDAAGAALRAVVQDGGADLIKPNDDELADLVGTSFAGSDDLVGSALAAARELVPARVGAALVTLGAHGALLVTPESALHAGPPPIRVRSTVGAGDSSLAGYLLAELAGATAEGRLVAAIRHGAAAASLPGTQVPTPADLPPSDIVVTAVVP